MSEEPAAPGVRDEIWPRLIVGDALSLRKFELRDVDVPTGNAGSSIAQSNERKPGGGSIRGSAGQSNNNSATSTSTSSTSTPAPTNNNNNNNKPTIGTVTHVLTLGTELDSLKDFAHLSSKCVHKHISIRDSDYVDILPHLDEAVQFMANAVREGSVAVISYAGMTRAAAVALAFMMQQRKLKLEDARKIYGAQRAYRLMPQLVSQLQLWAKMDYNLNTSSKKYAKLLSKLKKQEAASIEHMKDAKDVEIKEPRTNKRISSLVTKKTQGKKIDKKRLSKGPNDSSDPAGGYTCAQCNYQLFSRNNILPHAFSPFDVSDWSCLYLFIEPMGWIHEDVNNNNGNIHCPCCALQLGEWDWDGLPCSCKLPTKVVPSFRLHKLRINSKWMDGEASVRRAGTSGWAGFLEAETAVYAAEAEARKKEKKRKRLERKAGSQSARGHASDSKSTEQPAAENKEALKKSARGQKSAPLVPIAEGSEEPSSATKNTTSTTTPTITTTTTEVPPAEASKDKANGSNTPLPSVDDAAKMTDSDDKPVPLGVSRLSHGQKKPRGTLNNSDKVPPTKPRSGSAGGGEPVAPPSPPLPRAHGLHKSDNIPASPPQKKLFSRVVGGFKRMSVNMSMSNNDSPSAPTPSPAAGGGALDFDELAVKKAKQETRDVAQVLEVTCREDLPKELMRLVDGAKIAPERVDENFEIMLNCLHFLTKHSFVYRPKVEGQAIDLVASSEKAPAPDKGKPRKSSTEERDDQEPEEEGVIYIGGPKGKKRRKKHKSTVPPDSELLSEGDVKRCYRIMEAVGQGGFGRVHAAKNMRGKGRVAIKKMPHVEERDKQRNMREVNFLRLLSHPNIVKYECAFLMKDEIWVVMQFMEGGTLTEAIKGYGFEEKHIAYAAREMLKGIAYLHSKKFIHRDLKSANIMMTTQGDVKLIDLGLCLDVAEDPYPQHMVGSPFWMPPEMIKRQTYGYPIDIWSFAICILELANGQPPHRKSALKAMFISGTTGYKDKPFEKDGIWSSQFKNFMESCLEPDQNLRATADQLLLHPFLEKADTRRGMKKILSTIFLQNTIEGMSLGGL